MGTVRVRRQSLERLRRRGVSSFYSFCGSIVGFRSGVPSLLHSLAHTGGAISLVAAVSVRVPPFRRVIQRRASTK